MIKNAKNDKVLFIAYRDENVYTIDFDYISCNDPSPHLATILSALGLNTKNFPGGHPSLALLWEQHA